MNRTPIAAAAMAAWMGTLASSEAGALAKARDSDAGKALAQVPAGDACALGHGAIATGVAYYDSGRLMAVGLLPSQIQGFAFLGGK